MAGPRCWTVRVLYADGGIEDGVVYATTRREAAKLAFALTTDAGDCHIYVRPAQHDQMRRDPE